jgi:hypothetical protein
MGVSSGTLRCEHLLHRFAMIAVPTQFSGGFKAAVDTIEEVSLYGDSHLVPLNPSALSKFGSWTALLSSCILIYLGFLFFKKSNLSDKMTMN